MNPGSCAGLRAQVASHAELPCLRCNSVVRFVERLDVLVVPERNVVWLKSREAHDEEASVSEPSFWETLERVAALSGGAPVPRPRLVEVVGGNDGGESPEVDAADEQAVRFVGPSEYAASVSDAGDGGPGEAGTALGASEVVESATVRPAGDEERAGPRAGTPVARADAVFHVLEQTQHPEVLAEFGRRELPDGRGEAPPSAVTPATWDDVDEGVAGAPSGFLAGLAAKHRIFAETGEIDIDLDRADRRKRRRRGRSG